MGRLILSHCNVKFLQLLWFLTFLCHINGHQDVEHTTLDLQTTTLDIDNYLKNLEDEAKKRIEKNKMCHESNITILVMNNAEDNVILVLFEYTDKKFQTCFKYFKVTVENKRKAVKEAIIRYYYENQNNVSHRFENVSCGEYQIIVVPCFTDRSCAGIYWPYGRTTHVTGKACRGNFKTKISFDENNNGKVIIISSITAFLFLVAICGLMLYCYLSGKWILKKVEDNTSVTEYVQVPTSEDNRTEIKSVFIYIFHSYYERKGQDRQQKIKSKVEAVKKLLTLLLEYFLVDTIQRGIRSPLYFSIKTIDSELPKILFCPNDWLNDALDERGKDGILRKIILVESEVEDENEDCLENLIFSEFKNKLKNNVTRCQEGYDSLFVLRLSDIPTSRTLENNHGPQVKDYYGLSKNPIKTQPSNCFNFFQFCIPFLNPVPSIYNPQNHSHSSVLPTYSKEFVNVVNRCRYYFPTHLFDLCFDLCSSSGLCAIEDKKDLKILLQHRLNEILSSVQAVWTFAEDC